VKKYLLFCISIAFVFGMNSFAQAQTSCENLLGQNRKISSAIRFNWFMTKRRLQDYYQELPTAFSSALNELRPQDTWIDLGGGRGLAIEDYLKIDRGYFEKPAQTVLITYNLGRLFGISDYDGKLKVLKGRLFEEIPDSEIPRAKLMTDVMGVLSYTKDLSTVLRKIFDHLEVEGSLFVSSNTMMTLIDMPDGRHDGGRHLNLFSFLKEIDGLYVMGNPISFRVVKKQENIVIPDLQLIDIDESERPFFRRFSKKEGT
jgi:hypothetical protein